MFILIIWLQGVWLPLHGYSFSATPLWAGIYMVPLTVGFIVSRADRRPALGPVRPEAVRDAGMICSAACFFLLEALPVDFSYVWFALLLLAVGTSMGLFASPNRAQVMNSVPPDQRGVGSGMAATFQNSAMVLSIGVFFSLMVLGLAAALPSHLFAGLTAAGVPAATATRISHLPPVGVLFAAFLGDNPIRVLLGSTMHQISPAHARLLTSRSFFPYLISAPFENGLRQAFDFAGAACLVAALGVVAERRRGYVNEETADEPPSPRDQGRARRRRARRGGGPAGGRTGLRRRRRGIVRPEPKTTGADGPPRVHRRSGRSARRDHTDAALLRGARPGAVLAELARIAAPLRPGSRSPGCARFASCRRCSASSWTRSVSTSTPSTGSTPFGRSTARGRRPERREADPGRGDGHLGPAPGAVRERQARLARLRGRAPGSCRDRYRSAGEAAVLPHA